MAHKITRSFNANLIPLFQQAIKARNVSAVKKALKAGVDPATLVDGDAPLDLLLNDLFEDSEAAQDGCADENEFAQKTTQIVEALLDAGLPLIEPDVYSNGMLPLLADRFYSSTNIFDSSTVILHALQQSLAAGNSAYQPDILRQLADAASGAGFKKEADITGFINKGLSLMQNVHETVRARLLKPRSELERDLAENHSARLGFWLQPFPRLKSQDALAAFDLQSYKGGLIGLQLKATGTSGYDGDAKVWSLGERQHQNGQLLEERLQRLSVHPEVADIVKGLVKELPKRNPLDILREVEATFVGNPEIKRYFKQMMIALEYDRACVAKGLPDIGDKYHMSLSGPPGTGKSSIGRLTAELLYALDLCGPFYAEVGRENIAGAFDGQTEQTIVALLGLADTLFVDEAYALHDERSGSSIGRIIVNALVSAMDKPAAPNVFLAGYEGPLRKMIASNHGLSSRITKHLRLATLDRAGLGEVLDIMLAAKQLTMTGEARSYVLDRLEDERRAKTDAFFANGRAVRNVVQALRGVLAERLFGESVLSGAAVMPDLSVAVLRGVELADVKAIDYKVVFAVQGEQQTGRWNKGFGVHSSDNGIVHPPRLVRAAP